LTKKY